MQEVAFKRVRFYKFPGGGGDMLAEPLHPVLSNVTENPALLTVLGLDIPFITFEVSLHRSLRPLL